ncbi:hypothetical protein A4A49_51924, partial [Nicotiana attenuata]
MAIDTITTPTRPVLDHNHPLYLHPSNGPVALLGKNKLCLVDGTTSKGDFGSGLAHQWDRCNAIERFDKVNASRLYYLPKEIFTSTQGISSVSVYFTRLTDLWAEYDAILPPPPVKDYVEQLEFQRLLQFFMGLNDSFEQARSHILMMPNVPSINQAYAMIVQDESRRTISSSQFNTHTGQVEPTAMFTSQSGSRQRRNFGENCYKVVGYPSDFKPKRRANVAAQIENTVAQEAHNGVPTHMFTNEQYSQILQLLNKNSIGESSGTIAAMADTGATNHMIGNKDLLHNGTQTENAGQVQLPTGDSAKITHVGDCQLSGGDTIKNVLCVPTFKFNLLSVSKVTKDLNCFASFFPTFCVFQDLWSGRVKEIGREEDGLYTMIS